MLDISLSFKEQQILLGGILGDSYFSKKKNIVRFSHSNKQEEYLLWKYNQFSKDDVRGIYTRHYKEGYINYSFEFVNKQNKYLDLFNFIDKNLYTNSGRKKISMKYLNQIDSLGLAIWWMDDGSLSVHKGNRYGKLCTHCFNYEENILIQQYFKQKWNIDVDIRVEKQKYYFIRLNVTALKKLIRIIYMHVTEIPSMIYKIDLNYTRQASIGDFGDVYFYIKEIKNQHAFIEGTLETAGCA